MNAEASDPRLGQLIGDRYRITGQLGRGGMGTVYRAEHVVLKRPVALKLLDPVLGTRADFGRRFEREALAMGRIAHPHCVTISDFGHLDDGGPYLVMEHLDGVSLGALLDREGRLEPARALRILRQTLLGLGHAHGLGVVHRDIKPDNIFLIECDGDPDFVKVLDFGIAKLVGSGGDEVEGTQLTQTGVAVGTPKYLAPEQAYGDTVDARTDLYSATVVLYEMIAGEPPFVADEAIAIVTQHLTATPRPLSEAAAGQPISPQLDELVRRGLAKARAARFPSARAYVDAIDACLAELGQPRPQTAPVRHPTPLAYEATIAVPTPTAQPTVATPWRRPRRRVRAAIIGGLALLFVLVAAGKRDGKPRFETYVDTLQNAKTCEERRDAVRALHTLGDKRAIPALKSARHRMRGGVLGIGDSNTNRCLRDDAERAIEYLQRLP